MSVSKIVVTSDLHLGITNKDEIRALVDEINAFLPDFLVVAGDIGELGCFEECLKILDGVKVHKRAFLAGNHDLWVPDKGVSSVERWEKILPGIAKDLGWVWLEDEILSVGKAAVVGSIAWYDYSAGAGDVSVEEFRQNKRLFNNDANFMDVEWDDVAFARSCQEGLLSRLKRADQQFEEIIVVTHVPVFKEQKVEHLSDEPFAHAYFYNFSLGEQILRFSKVREVVSGHTHRGVEAFLECCDVRARVIASDYHAPGYVIVGVPAS